MNNTLQNIKGKVYLDEVSPRKKSSHKTSKNNSLPFINLQNQQKLKMNIIHRHIQRTQYQIISRRARNKALHRQIQKNQAKKNKALKQMQYIKYTKSRLSQDQSFKKQQQKKRQELQIQLKLNASLMRKKIEQSTLRARQLIKQQNKQKGDQIRHLIQEGQQYIDTVMTEDLNRKKIKKQQVKKWIQEAAIKLQQFKTSRISFSKQNYQSRVQKSLKKVNKAKKIVNILDNKQENLIELLKKTQIQYLNSLKQLEKLKENPQKGQLNNSNSFKI